MFTQLAQLPYLLFFVMFAVAVFIAVISMAPDRTRQEAEEALGFFQAIRCARTQLASRRRAHRGVDVDALGGKRLQDGCDGL